MSAQQPGDLPVGATIDSWLSVGEWAVWMRIAPTTAVKRARDLRRKGVIPREGVPKIHVRTYLASLGPQFRKALEWKLQ